MAHYRTINHDKEFIAFFSPKCGSTTIRDWFFTSLELSEPFEYVTVTRYLIQASDVEKYPSYRKIFFIRNPFQRLVSFYCDFVVGGTRLWCFADDEGQSRLEGRTFAELVKTLAELARQGKPFQHHLQSQLKGVEGIEFDTVVPIERFDVEIRVLNRELDIDYEPRRLNATRYGKGESGYVYDLKPQEIAQLGAPSREIFYNEELVDIVSTLFRDDIKYYELHSSGPPRADA